MLKKRLTIIKEILETFSGKEGEPQGEKERYILCSMWVMAVAEFEGSVKILVEDYIRFIKDTKNTNDLHISILLKIFYPNREKLSKAEVEGIYEKDIQKVDFQKIIDPKKPRNKSESISELFKNIGVTFSKSDFTNIGKLNGISSTRDSIAHGDENIQITKAELNNNLNELAIIFEFLKNKIENIKESNNALVSPQKRTYCSFLARFFHIGRV